MMHCIISSMEQLLSLLFKIWSNRLKKNREVIFCSAHLREIFWFRTVPSSFMSVMYVRLLVFICAKEELRQVQAFSLNSQ